MRGLKGRGLGKESLVDTVDSRPIVQPTLSPQNCSETQKESKTPAWHMHITLLSSPFIVELELGDLGLAGWLAGGDADGEGRSSGRWSSRAM
jgi:hypothetical protein